MRREKAILQSIRQSTSPIQGEPTKGIRSPTADGPAHVLHAVKQPQREGCHTGFKGGLIDLHISAVPVKMMGVIDSDRVQSGPSIFSMRDANRRITIVEDARTLSGFFECLVLRTETIKAPMLLCTGNWRSFDSFRGRSSL